MTEQFSEGKQDPPNSLNDGRAMNTPAAPIAEQIENAYTRVGIGKAHYFIVGMLLLGVFFDALEQNAVGITGPVLQSYWGLDSAGIGVLNTITFTATAVGRLVTGFIADRYGRRTTLILNLVIFAGGSLLCALAPSYLVLALGRGISGFGLGGEIAVAVVMISEYFGARHRGTAVGLINVTAAGFGNMLAPAFGIAVFNLFPGLDRWRWVFGFLFVPVLLVIYFRRYVPETPRYLISRGHIAKANEVISRLALGKLRAPVETTEYIRVTHRLRFQAMSGWVYRSRWDLFKGKYLARTILMSIAVACSYAAQISMLTLMPSILVSNGHTVNTSLWYTLLMQSGSLAGALVAALVAGRVPRKKMLTAASSLGAIAGILIAFLGHSVVLIIIFGWLFNFAVIIINTTIWLYAPELFPTGIRGFGTSVILAMGSLSGGLFPIITGVVFDSYGLMGMFSILAGVFVILGIVIRFPPETFGRPMEEDN